MMNLLSFKADFWNRFVEMHIVFYGVIYAKSIDTN